VAALTSADKIFDMASPGRAPRAAPARQRLRVTIVDGILLDGLRSVLPVCRVKATTLITNISDPKDPAVLAAIGTAFCTAGRMALAMAQLPAPALQCSMMPLMPMPDDPSTCRAIACFEVTQAQAEVLQACLDTGWLSVQLPGGVAVATTANGPNSTYLAAVHIASRDGASAASAVSPAMAYALLTEAFKAIPACAGARVLAVAEVGNNAAGALCLPLCAPYLPPFDPILVPQLLNRRGADGSERIPTLLALVSGASALHITKSSPPALVTVSSPNPNDKLSAELLLGLRPMRKTSYTAPAAGLPGDGAAAAGSPGAPPPGGPGSYAAALRAAPGSFSPSPAAAGASGSSASAHAAPARASAGPSAAPGSAVAAPAPLSAPAAADAAAAPSPSAAAGAAGPVAEVQEVQAAASAVAAAQEPVPATTAVVGGAAAAPAAATAAASAPVSAAAPSHSDPHTAAAHAPLVPADAGKGTAAPAPEAPPLPAPGGEGVAAEGAAAAQGDVYLPMAPITTAPPSASPPSTAPSSASPPSASPPSTSQPAPAAAPTSGRATRRAAAASANPPAASAPASGFAPRKQIKEVLQAKQDKERGKRSQPHHPPVSTSKGRSKAHRHGTGPPSPAADSDCDADMSAPSVSAPQPAAAPDAAGTEGFDAAPDPTSQ
jgi:hypothetical protein